MKPKSSEPQCRHRADLDMASQCREGSWFVFSISFAFHGDNFMLRIPLAILKCLPVGHRALWTPPPAPFPASPEKALPFFLTGSAQVACPGQKSCGGGDGLCRLTPRSWMSPLEPHRTLPWKLGTLGRQRSPCSPHWSSSAVDTWFLTSTLVVSGQVCRCPGETCRC